MNKNTRPDWDEYFLNIAREVGKRATCLRRRYGAIIVKDKIIISTGYNGAPRGEMNCIDSGICERERLHVPKGERYELCVAVHAEQNAIINADPEKMTGATIYIAGVNCADNSNASGEPCKLCRRMIVNALPLHHAVAHVRRKSDGMFPFHEHFDSVAVNVVNCHANRIRAHVNHCVEHCAHPLAAKLFGVRAD